jgi:hypothetical protein
VLVFSAADGAEMNFKSSSLTFQPGNNTVQLTAKRSTIPGKYSGKEVRVRYQKLEFIVQVPSKLHKRAILDIERSGSSLELFQLTPSSNVNQKSLDLIITTGDIELGNPDIEFLCMTSIDLDLKKPLEFSIACSETTTTWTQSCVNGKVTLPRVERGSVIKTSLDYRIPGEKSVDHIVKLILRDHLENQNKIMYSKVVHLQLSRPFELNYSLRHNAKCSLLQCCFIGQENLPVRIGKISWEPKESVTAMVPQENGILFPQQRIQFGALLKLEKKEDLKISIEYQSVTKEIEHYIIDRCNHHCKAENVPLVAGVLKRFVKRHVFPLIKPFDLCYFGILRLQELEIEPIVNSLVNVSEKQQNHVREAIKKLNRDLVLIQDTDINQSFNGLTPQKVVYQEPVSPCNVLITPKWISGNETKEVQVGETLPFTLVVSPTIWRSDMQVKALLTIQQDSGRLAIGGKQKVEMKFEVFQFNFRKKQIRLKSQLRLYL